MSDTVTGRSVGKCAVPAGASGRQQFGPVKILFHPPGPVPAVLHEFYLTAGLGIGGGIQRYQLVVPKDQIVACRNLSFPETSPRDETVRVLNLFPAQFHAFSNGVRVKEAILIQGSGPFVRPARFIFSVLPVPLF